MLINAALLMGTVILTRHLAKQILKLKGTTNAH